MTWPFLIGLYVHRIRTDKKEKAWFSFLWVLSRSCVKHEGRTNPEPQKKGLRGLNSCERDSPHTAPARKAPNPHKSEPWFLNCVCMWWTLTRHNLLKKLNCFYCYGGLTSPQRWVVWTPNPIKSLISPYSAETPTKRSSVRKLRKIFGKYIGKRALDEYKIRFLYKNKKSFHIK